MAETKVTTNGEGGKPDWQVEREKMAADVRRYVLDPFAVVAGWMIDMQNQESENFYMPDHDELGRLLTLMTMGAHNELDTISAYYGHMSPVLTDILKAVLKRQWDKKGGGVA
jgi:hypothetical protein